MIGVRWLWRWAAGAAGVACLAASVQGQVAARPRTPAAMSFRFDHPVAGVAVPRYTIDVWGDGTGLYHAEVPVGKTAELQALDRSLVFTPETVGIVLGAIKAMRTSGVPCASRVKNVADTGAKTLTWHGAEGDGSCSFNYTENKAAIQLTTLFEGIENTLEQGRILDFKHRYDRLGLDAEMAALAAAVQEGRAVELGNIAPTLRSIAADTELIERVRLRAAKLLDRAQIAG